MVGGCWGVVDWFCGGVVNSVVLLCLLFVYSGFGVIFVIV